MGLFSKLKDVVKSTVTFDLHAGKEIIKEIGKNPERALLGAGDPLSTKFWNKATGNEWQPVVNQWGGPTEAAFLRAQQAGIDVRGARLSHKVAQTVAQAYTMKWAGGKIGNLGGLTKPLLTSAGRYANTLDNSLSFMPQRPRAVTPLPASDTTPAFGAPQESSINMSTVLIGVGALVAVIVIARNS